MRDPNKNKEPKSFNDGNVNRKGVNLGIQLRDNVSSNSQRRSRSNSPVGGGGAGRMFRNMQSN